MVADDDDSARTPGPKRGAASIPPGDDDEIVGGSVAPDVFVDPMDDDLIIDDGRGIEGAGDVVNIEEEGPDDAADRIPAGSDNDSITSGMGTPQLSDDEAISVPAGPRPVEAPESLDTLPASNIDDTLFSAEEANDNPNAAPANDTVGTEDDGTRFIRHIERE